MSLVNQIRRVKEDPVRMVQVFMMCRLGGILLSSIVIARVLPMEQVGVFELLMLCGYLMTFFWSDALLKGYLGIFAGKSTPPQQATFLILLLLAAFLAMAILVGGRDWVIPLITDRRSLEGLAWFAIYQAFIIPFWLAPFLDILRKQQIWVAGMFVLIGPSFAGWIGFSAIPAIEGVLIGLMSYALVGFLWVMASLQFPRRLDIRKMIIQLWPLIWPLMLYAISTAIAKSFDAWLVARQFDESTFAIFRYGAREFPLVVALATGLSTSIISRLIQPDGMSELKTRSTRLMHICYPLVILLLLLSTPLFVFFFGKDYEASARIFNLYLLLTLTQLVFPQSVLTSKGDTRLLWYVSLIELGVNVVASYMLLQWLGLVGIVWGTIIAFAFEKIVLLFILHRRYAIAPGHIISFRVWGTYVILMVAAFILSGWVAGL